MDLFCYTGWALCRFRDTSEVRKSKQKYFVSTSYQQCFSNLFPTYRNSHSYCHAHGKHPREERTKSAIMSMGTSILGATMTTFSVSVLMLFCQVLFFVKFAQLLIVTIAFSLYGGLVFFSVIVDCFGPDEPLQTYAKLKSTLWKDKKATTDSVSETESNLPPSQTPRNYVGEINRIQRRLSTLSVNTDFTSSGGSNRNDAAARPHNEETNTSSSLTISSSSPNVSNSSKDNRFGLEESGHVAEVELRQATLTKLYSVGKMVRSNTIVFCLRTWYLYKLFYF